MTITTIPPQRTGPPDDDGSPPHLNWYELRAKQLAFFKREKLKLLKEAVEKRDKAASRRVGLIELWRREQRAVGTPRALSDAEDERVYTAYGGKRASDDPEWKSLMADHASCLTRASAIATMEIALRLEVANELASRRCDQNDAILKHLEFVSDFLRGCPGNRASA